MVCELSGDWEQKFHNIVNALFDIRVNVADQVVGLVLQVRGFEDDVAYALMEGRQKQEREIHKRALEWYIAEIKFCIDIVFACCFVLLGASQI